MNSGSPPPDPSGLNEDQLDESIDRITASILNDARTRHLSAAYLPDRAAVIAIIEQLQTVIFPGFFSSRELSEKTMRWHVASVVKSASGALFEQVSGALRYEVNLETTGRAFEERCDQCDARARQVVGVFFGKIPEIRRTLSLDVQAAYDGDPAAHHVDETIFCYPGVRALMVHRLAHELYRQKIPLIPRIMNEYAHTVTGIDIHPGASIGKSFFIDHGTGVVIGETTVIGDHCKIYQGVTLGGKGFPRDEHGRIMRGIRRHPTLEDYVTVYAGATILGGDVIIGAGSVINGGVFVTGSVPPGHVVRGPKFESTMRSNPEMPPPSYSI